LATATGTSSKSYQDALDKAIASALKKTGGADRSITWTVKAAAGSAGGIKPVSKFKVTIESTVD
jgi:flavin-binding protein dodecin